MLMIHATCHPYVCSVMVPFAAGKCHVDRSADLPFNRWSFCSLMVGGRELNLFSQWLTFKLLGITYLVGNIFFSFYFMVLWLSKWKRLVSMVSSSFLVDKAAISGCIWILRGWCGAVQKVSKTHAAWAVLTLSFSLRRGGTSCPHIRYNMKGLLYTPRKDNILNPKIGWLEDYFPFQLDILDDF